MLKEHCVDYNIQPKTVKHNELGLHSSACPSSFVLFKKHGRSFKVRLPFFLTKIGVNRAQNNCSFRAALHLSCLGVRPHLLPNPQHYNTSDFVFNATIVSTFVADNALMSVRHTARTLSAKPRKTQTAMPVIYESSTQRKSCVISLHSAFYCVECTEL